MDTMLKSLFTCFLAKTRRGVSWKNRGHGPGGCCYSDWGCYSQLLRELDEEDPPSYRSWLRMDKDAFNFLLRMVEPQTRGRDAQLCEAILAGECLTITLRYLATGFTFSALEYTFCVSQHNILNCYLDLQRHVWEPQEGIHESADDSGGVGGHSKEVWGKLELPTLSWFPKWQTHHHTVSTECWFPFIIITKGPTPLCLWR